jgi:hypothetical protein
MTYDHQGQPQEYPTSWMYLDYGVSRAVYLGHGPNSEHGRLLANKQRLERDKKKSPLLQTVITCGPHVGDPALCYAGVLERATGDGIACANFGPHQIGIGCCLNTTVLASSVLRRRLGGFDMQKEKIGWGIDGAA